MLPEIYFVGIPFLFRFCATCLRHRSARPSPPPVLVPLRPFLPKARYRLSAPITVLYTPGLPMPKARYRHSSAIIVLYHPLPPLPKARYGPSGPITVLYACPGRGGTYYWARWDSMGKMRNEKPPAGGHYAKTLQTAK